MSVYTLVRATTNGTTDYLLLVDDKVVSRWPHLDDPSDLTGLADWDNQRDAGVDLGDYQAALDAGQFDVTVLATETNPGQHRTIMSEFDCRAGKWFHSVRDSETDERVRYQDDRLIDAGCDSLSIASDAARHLGLPEPSWVDHDGECIWFGYDRKAPATPA